MCAIWELNEQVDLYVGGEEDLDVNLEVNLFGNLGVHLDVELGLWQM